MRLLGGPARYVLVSLLLVAPGLTIPVQAAASDVCPTVLAASALPDPSAAVEIDSGEALAAVRERLSRLAQSIAAGGQVSKFRQIPDPLPVEDDQAWVWQFGYLVDPEHPGDTIEQIAPRYEAILCVGTRVPETVGQTVSDTLAALEARALAPSSDAAGDWSVVGLDPPPGELVEFGVPVGIAAEPPQEAATEPGADERATEGPTTDAPTTQVGRPPTQVPADAGDDGSSPSARWPWLILIVAVTAAAAAGVGHRARSRRHARDPDVEARVREDSPHTEVSDLAGRHASHTVRIQAHGDSPHISLTRGESDGGASPDDS